MSEDNVHDVAGRLVASTDASGTVTRTVYDKLGTVARTWRQSGDETADETTCRNTADGQVLTEQGADTIGHIYDPAGQEVERQSGAGTATTRYDAQGQAIQQVEPGLEKPASAVYDADGNMTSSTAPGNTEADATVYDEAGNVVSENPAGAEATTYEYDADGNEVSVSEPIDGGPGQQTVESTSVHDVGGRLIKRTDAKGFVTTFTYDELDRQLAAVSGGLAATKTYNTLGWVLSETDLDSRVKTFAYDRAGRVVAETLSAKTTATAYDGMGRVVAVTNADGTSTHQTYDAFGRAVSETQKDASGQSVRAITRTFDGWGRERLSTEALRGVRSESTWSGQTRETHSLGYGETTVTVTTDGAGRETSLEADRGSATVSRELARDTAGRVTGLTLDAGTALSQSRAYDAGSGVLSSQEGAGLGSGGIDYEYSAATSRQVREAIDLAYPATSADRDRTFVHDEAGRVVKSTDAGSQAVYFTYTSDGRITSAGRRTFAYSDESTRTSQQIASMTEDGVTTAFSFDGRGRRSGHSSASGSVTYSYDDADRMTGFAKDAGSDGTIEVSAAYAYDAAGQRTRSVVTNSGVTTTTEWTYEGLTLLRAESVTGTSTTSVEYVNDAEGRPAGGWVKVPAHATAVFVWLVTDARGDVLGLITSEGTPLSYRSYGAFGERLGGASRAAGALSATAAAQVDAAITLGYAGYTFDAESGLSYCSQRYYDPVTCQWTTKDPARADGEESAYQYCGGDPVGRVDPSGLWATGWHLVRCQARTIRARLSAAGCAAANWLGVTKTPTSSFTGWWTWWDIDIRVRHDEWRLNNGRREWRRRSWTEYHSALNTEWWFNTRAVLKRVEHRVFSRHRAMDRRKFWLITGRATWHHTHRARWSTWL